MRTQVLAAVASASVVALSPAFSLAQNRIGLENAKPVTAADDWQPAYDANYHAMNIGVDGDVDVYPSSWSVRNGEHLGIRVSTTAHEFRTRIYRIGWYRGMGSRLVFENADTPGVRQPFPPENTETGLAECHWSDSVSLTIPDDWVTGAYVVRITTDVGLEAYTYFFLRDDLAPARAPILYVDPIATANAYNEWPLLLDANGVQTAGKSLYKFNSAGAATQASGDVQAVAVSFDRPQAENWGLGGFADWSVPFVQWLEYRGWDVAYATSLDLDARPELLQGRKLWVDAGHDEYWSMPMWDHLAAARDAGLSLGFFSGNDLLWQVRFEPGSGGAQSTLIGYKDAAYPDVNQCGTCSVWGGDPEYRLALAAKSAGDVAGQVAHLSRVTYRWTALSDWEPKSGTSSSGRKVPAPAPITRSGASLEGLVNGPMLPGCTPSSAADDVCHGARWIVDDADHWIYTGDGVHNGAPTGLAEGDEVPFIVGYEMDYVATPSATIPAVPSQVILAHTDSVGFAGLFNAQYSQAASGAHVFAAGTINWPWGLERPNVGQWGGIALDAPAAGGRTKLSAVISAMTANFIFKALERSPTAYAGATGTGPEGGIPEPAAETTASVTTQSDSTSSGGCSLPARGARTPAVLALGALFGALAVTRTRRRTRSQRRSTVM
jgi:hypothetical protein